MLANPIDYDDLANGVQLADSPLSNNPDAGLLYDTGIFNRYPDDKRQLEYVPPTFGELPLHELAKRELIPGEDEDGNDASIDVHKDFFASLFAFIRPERGADSADPPKVPLHGLVQAVETTLLNSANVVNAQHSNAETSSTTTTTTGTSSAETTVSSLKKVSPKDENRIVRAIEILSTAKTDDTDELTDKDYKFDVDVDGERGRSNDLSLLAPIAFTVQKDEKETVNDPISAPTNTETIAVTTDSNDSIEAATNSNSEISPKSQPVHQTNITVIKSTNSTHLVPNGDVVHVQHQQIQQSIFHSNLAILPTIPSHRIDIPSSTPAIVNSDGNNDDTELCNDDSSSSEGSSEENQNNKKKCQTNKSQEATTSGIHEEVLKKVQKLQEQIAEIEAEPVILTQGV